MTAPLLLLLAARLEAVAGWLDDSKAAGKPPAYLVDQAIAALREIAATARAEAAAAHFPPGADQDGGTP